jgi:hypothetical protein
VMVPASAAAAATLKSAPGCRTSSRNIRAASAGSARKDQENTARTAVVSSLSMVASRSSRTCKQASLVDAPASVTCARASGNALGGDPQRQRVRLVEIEAASPRLGMCGLPAARIMKSTK